MGTNLLVSCPLDTTLCPSSPFTNPPFPFNTKTHYLFTKANQALTCSPFLGGIGDSSPKSEIREIDMGVVHQGSHNIHGLLP